MNQAQWDKVDHYFTNLLAPSDPALEAALEASHKARLPAISVTATQGKLLHILARARNARKILEIGTLGGYSTIWLARALPRNGRLITLEADPRHAKVAQENIDRAGLSRIVEIRMGLAQESLPKLVREKVGPFDLTFIDADKEGYPEYLGWALKLSRPGSLIVADNVVQDGAITDSKSESVMIKGIRKFNQLLASDSRVTATAIQTVGTKGYDGFVVALVTSLD